MKILTGNDLKTGAVVWWAGSRWSLAIADATDVGDQGDAIAAAETAALRVVGAYVITGEKTAGGIRPAHIKERIRAVGPTMRYSLAVQPPAAEQVL